ncbi:MAG: 1-acyl-sn-glycerol-3-phosphate acyltransferase [candidate division KSB1 bacterium]|nr:1-acyl-sn-glycerol-3-phosphate acyltransferase [candidate division KSB1 bacterium]
MLSTGWCWTVGLALFTVLALAVLVAALLLPLRVYDPFLKWACRTLLRVCGVRVRVEGSVQREVLPCLFLGNHVNILDPLIYGGYLPGPVRGVELASHFRWPVYGWVIRRIGNVPIEQSYGRGFHRSYRKAAEQLRRGVSVAVLPEGHRTRDGTLLPFTRAPFAFAREAQVPIVPVALVGAYEICRKGSLRISPGVVRLRIGSPMMPAEASAFDASHLRTRVREAIEKLLEEGQAPGGSGEVPPENKGLRSVRVPNSDP